VRLEVLGKIKIPNDFIGNQTSDFPACNSLKSIIFGVNEDVTEMKSSISQLAVKINTEVAALLH
jgi:hypothetical protein